MKIFQPTFLLGALAVTALTVSPAVAAEAGSKSEQATKAKKPKKITDRGHPDFIRCRSEPIMGSLARKKRTCMTNSQWAEHNQEGNKRAREMVEDMQSGASTSN